MDMDRYTTFHLKTTLFWLCEEAPPSFWDESGLFFSVKVLLKKFNDCVINMKLPNYFAPQHNLLFQMHFGEMIEKVGPIHRALKGYPFAYGIHDMLKAGIFDCINEYFPEIMKSMKNVIEAANSDYSGFNWQNPPSFDKWKGQFMCLQLARHFKFLATFLTKTGGFLGNGNNIDLADFYEVESQHILDRVRKAAHKCAKDNALKCLLEKVLIAFSGKNSLSLENIEDIIDLYENSEYAHRYVIFRKPNICMSDAEKFVYLEESDDDYLESDSENYSEDNSDISKDNLEDNSNDNLEESDDDIP